MIKQFSSSDKTSSLKRNIKDFSMIIIGAAIVAAGYVFFITPYKIIPGGIYGIAIVLHYISAGFFSFMPEGLPIGLTALCFNIPLAIIAFRLLSAENGLRTVITFLATSAFVDFFSWLGGLQKLVEGDPLLAAIYGGVIIGVGVSMIFKANATSAGTDVISKLIARYSHISIGTAIMLVDSVIVLMGLIAFREWSVPLYSLITIFIYGKVVEILMTGLSVDRAVFIISDKTEELRQEILYTLKRGGTFFHGEGMYNGQEKQIIYLVVNNRDIPNLRFIISKIDPCAFVTILPAQEILGKGFKSIDEVIKK